MIELIRAHHLNIMLAICGACAMLIVLLLMTRSISKRRKRELLVMELVALFLLWFDRLAYIYAGVHGTKGYYMVRITNFMVFFLTSGMVLGFNLYLSDILHVEGGLKTLPKRVKTVGVLAVIGMLLAVVSAFTGLYYHFDENNLYHRGQGFLIAYIIPVLGPIIQYSVVRSYKKLFSRQMYISLALYVFVPIACGVLQVFLYGISLVNMSMVLVSVSLYISTYIDINNKVEHAHEIEINNMKSEQEHLQKLFDQTATAFVSAVEKKDDFVKGNSVKIAEYAVKIAKLAGKNEEDCEKVYYAALLHDVGMIGIPDSVIKNDNDPARPDYEKMKQKPVIGREILSSITEYPYLCQAAYYSHERYNGTGYPQGLKGEEIPEIARIVAAADAYVTMTTRKRYREARPDFVVRETFIRGAGEQFDPVFADYMVRIIDSESKDKPVDDMSLVGTSLSCGEYRDNISGGIPVEREVRRITFECVPSEKKEGEFSAPAIVLFDSYDNRVHTDEKTIREYVYFEYGEFWFDDHSICTGARKIEVTKLEKHDDPKGSRYEIIAARFEDHIRLTMISPALTRELTVALPDGTRSAYIGLTGEHCEISGITFDTTGEKVSEGDIPRIAKAISYIDHMESDVKNIQVARTRSVSTEGIVIDRRLRLVFHTQSLLGANLIWHCPYIVLFSAKDGQVYGDGYREYALIKLNGEMVDADGTIKNRFNMQKTAGFPGWEAWKEANRDGMKCEALFEQRGSTIEVSTDNLGIKIDCVMTVDSSEKVYAALTGDQVALTDIRVMQ